VDSSGDTRREDIMFIHCGGKARMPIVVNSLRNLDVPVRVIADFDVLNNELPLKEIVEALSANWNSVENNWNVVKKSIESKKPELNTTEVTNEIKRVLDSIQEKVFPSDAKKKIQSILRRSSPWSTAKSVGEAYIPSGDITVAYNSMRDELEKFGLFIVPVGELEGFDRSIGGHGPKWVNEVLERDLSRDPELETARKFVKKIIT
jgi:hypothetical protein